MRLLKRITLVLTIIVLFSFIGCGKKRIGATYDPFVIFPATAQWTWDESLNRSSSDPSLTPLKVRPLLREAVTEGLARHGYTLAQEGEKVDFRIHYQLGIGRKIERDSTQGYASLSLTLVEASTDKKAWVGFVKTDADVTLSETDRRNRLQKQIDEMLKDFPPSQAN